MKPYGIRQTGNTCPCCNDVTAKFGRHRETLVERREIDLDTAPDDVPVVDDFESPVNAAVYRESDWDSYLDFLALSDSFMEDFS